MLHNAVFFLLHSTLFLETEKPIICPKSENRFGFYGGELRGSLQLNEALVVWLIKLAFSAINGDSAL